MCPSKPLGCIIEQNKYSCPQEAYGPAWFPFLYNADHASTYEVIFRRSEVMFTKYLMQCLMYNKHTIKCSFSCSFHIAVVDKVSLGCTWKSKAEIDMIQQSHLWIYTQRKENYYLGEAPASPTTWVAALFTVTKTWKQPKCLSADEWVKNMWYLFIMAYYSAFKKRRKSCCWQQHGRTSRGLC